MAPAKRPETVVIVGGSLAGLVHALALLSLPSPPKICILERSPTKLLHNQGGVVAEGEIQQFFDEYVNTGRDITVLSKSRHYLNKQGKVMSGSVEERSQPITSWDLLYNLLRWRVEGMESRYSEGLQQDKRPRATYSHGCNVYNIRKTPNQKRITLEYYSAQAGGNLATTADMVIAADGASSAIRRVLLPDVERKYVGYVVWRGTVPELELSTAATEAFSEKVAFYYGEGLQILGCLVPGENGSIEEGKRLFNWIWHTNVSDAEGCYDFDELMTDKNGKRHPITLPPGGMTPQLWMKQKEYAEKVLPPQFAECVKKTRDPSVQAITDVISPTNTLMDGKVLLVGDALAGFRPHIAASTSQAAYDAIELGRWLRGEISRQEYDEHVMRFAKRLQDYSVVLGERSQFGRHPLAGD